MFQAASCREERPRDVAPIAHTEAFDIWPDSIDLHEGVILRACSDSVMQVRVNGNILDTINAGEVTQGRMRFKSSYPLLDFLYRLEASRPSAGRYLPLTPYEIYLNPLQNDSARIILESRLKNGVVIPSETRRLGWPAVNSNAEWLLAAAELAVAREDGRWEKSVRHTARLILESDDRLSRNPVTGLFYGIPRYMASGHGIFPRWMETPDIFQQSTLAVNVAYGAAMADLSMPTDSLIDALKSHMWIPTAGYFSATAYGVPTTPLPLQSTDNLAQAIAVISGIIPDAMADAIIRKTPVAQGGVSLYQPQLPPASGEAREEIPATLRQAAWTVACARRGNEAAYAEATGMLFAVEGKRLLGYRHMLPAFRSTFTTFITRGLLGMTFSKEGVHFIPYVPETLPGEKTISDLEYRNATLDIQLNGTGKVISTFTIDGTPTEPFIPANLDGRHKIAITLAGATADPGSVTAIGKDVMAPLPPLADWTSGRQVALRHGERPNALPGDIQTENQRETLDQEGCDCRLVFINGILQEEISRDTYLLPDTRKLAVAQFTAFTDGKFSGFSTKPHIFLPPEKRHTIQASSMARSGTKILEDKTLASKFVESNRFHNRNISFDFDAPEGGMYLVEVHYANGLGVVNAQRKTALRSLRVNGREEGIFIFPQLSASSVTKGESESWQKMTGWSNLLTAKLERGTNHIELRYYQPSPVYADPNSNVVLFDQVRLTATQ